MFEQETLVVKLRLRNEALKVSKKKLQLQLRQVEYLVIILDKILFRLTAPCTEEIG